MFRWKYEHITNVELPLQEAWDFVSNPSNWPKWLKELESGELIGSFSPGSRVKLKVKDKPFDLVHLITGVIPYSEYQLLTQTPLLKQESLTTFKEITPGKTQITSQTYVVSLLVPFFKAKFLKQAEEAYSNFENVLKEISLQTIKS